MYAIRSYYEIYTFFCYPKTSAGIPLELVKYVFTLPTMLGVFMSFIICKGVLGVSPNPLYMVIGILISVIVVYGFVWQAYSRERHIIGVWQHKYLEPRPFLVGKRTKNIFPEENCIKFL